MEHVVILFVWIGLMGIIRYVDYRTDKDEN